MRSHGRDRWSGRHDSVQLDWITCMIGVVTPSSTEVPGMHHQGISAETDTGRDTAVRTQLSPVPAGREVI